MSYDTSTWKKLCVGTDCDRAVPWNQGSDLCTVCICEDQGITSVECETCEGSGEVQVQSKHGETYHTCPMQCEDGRMSVEFLAEWKDGFLTPEQAEERIIEDIVWGHA